MNDNIKWTEDMGQISQFTGLTGEGLNGFYELGCRALLFEALEFLEDKKGVVDLQTIHEGEIFTIRGVTTPRNKLGKQVFKLLTDSKLVTGKSGGQVSSVSFLLNFITRDGWDNVKAQLIELKKEKSLPSVSREGFVPGLVMFGIDSYNKNRESFMACKYIDRIYSEPIPTVGELMDDAIKYVNEEENVFVADDFQKYISESPIKK